MKLIQVTHHLLVAAAGIGTMGVLLLPQLQQLGKGLVHVLGQRGRGYHGRPGAGHGQQLLLGDRLAGGLRDVE